MRPGPPCSGPTALRPRCRWDLSLRPLSGDSLREAHPPLRAQKGKQESEAPRCAPKCPAKTRGSKQMFLITCLC